MQLFWILIHCKAQSPVLHGFAGEQGSCCSPRPHSCYRSMLAVYWLGDTGQDSWDRLSASMRGTHLMDLLILMGGSFFLSVLIPWCCGTPAFLPSAQLDFLPAHPNLSLSLPLASFLLCAHFIMHLPLTVRVNTLTRCIGINRRSEKK